MGHHEYGNMMGRMPGLGGMGWIGMIWIIMMLIIVVGAVFLIVYIVKNNNKRRDWSTSSNAVNILKERFARGEIDEDEYIAKKEVLEREDKKR